MSIPSTDGPAASPRKRALALAAGLSLLLGCAGRVERAKAPPGFETAERFDVPRDTQATVGDGLRIAVVRVGQAPAAVEGGARRTLAADLMVFVRGRSPEAQVVQVRAGQRLEAAGRALFIEELRSGRSARVILRALPAKG